MTNRREELTQASGIQCGELVGMHGEITMTHVLQAFKMGAEWADAHPVNPWHKVSEELPKNGGHYLCMNENKHIVELAFCGTKWVNSTQYFDVPLDAVLYWMEIPEIKED